MAGFLCGWIMTMLIDAPKEAIFSFETGTLLEIMFRLFVGSLMVTSLQYFISVLVPSFIWSIVIGFFGLVLNLFLLGFSISLSWNPYELLARVGTYGSGSDLGYILTYSEVLSILFSVILLYVGYKWYKHKNFKWAFLSSPRRFALLAIIVLIFGGLTAYVMQPNKMLNYSQTVFSGTLATDAKIKELYITDKFISDTVAVVPVINGKFNYTIKNNIPLNEYVVTVGQAFQQAVVFGKNDSIHINFKYYNNKVSAKITGTRLAENLMDRKMVMPWSSAEHYLESNMYIDDPEEFSRVLVNEWKDLMDETNSFRTADNYIAKNDYTDATKKLTTIKSINTWNKYLKKRGLMYPDQKTPENSDIKEMRNKVSMNDETLLMSPDYFDYVRNSLIEKNTSDIDENTKAIQAINGMPTGSFKDKMLYWQLDKSLKEASSASERNTLVNTYADAFGNKKYTKIINNSARIIENLSKGKPAPLFDAITKDNKPVNLADLKGKFVAIDVWATWCAPCGYQSPYFEKKAIKYKNENIQFVAASVDQRMDNWAVEVKAKSKSVLQLHVNDPDAFYKMYNINGIPRFILIDPAGNLVNVNMPQPSEETFEKLIRESLKLPEEK